MSRFFLIIVFAATVAVFSSCKRSATAEDKITEISMRYVQENLKEELHGMTVDSVCVKSINSLNRFNYVCASMNMLSQFEKVYYEKYSSAVESGDEEAEREMNVHLTAVHEAQDYYAECLERLDKDDKAYILYLVTACFYIGDRHEKFFYFLTPNLQVHPFNPLDSSPID